MLEALLRRDRLIVGTGLAVLTLLAWAYVLAGAGMGMSAWDMTVVSLFPHRAGSLTIDAMCPAHAAWTTAHWWTVVAMWWVMMMAMMVPSAAPMVLLYARATRHSQATGQLAQGTIPTGAFASGYLTVWLGFSVIAAVLQWALQQSALISSVLMASTNAGVSAGILVAAGLYQLSPLKHVCLRHCRNPAVLISRHWRPGTTGAFTMGLRHGAFCVGCCWVLMALLFVGGIMNVLWIAALAILVLLEKVAPYGAFVSRAAGVLLLAWGAATILI